MKYGTVQFAFGGDMANFVQAGKKTVSLMFVRRHKIEGDFPHIEGTGRAVRFTVQTYGPRCRSRSCDASRTPDHQWCSATRTASRSSGLQRSASIAIG